MFATLKNPRGIRRLAKLAAVPLLAAVPVVAGPAVPAAAGEAKSGHQVGGPVDETFKAVEKPPRTLRPLADEQVPAYQCPDSHPYLLRKNFGPAGSSILPGVEIRQAQTPWPIGVSITMGTSDEDAAHMVAYKGILDGPIASSAMNWSLTDQTYQVVLHCTKDRSLAAVYVAPVEF